MGRTAHTASSCERACQPVPKIPTLRASARARCRVATPLAAPVRIAIAVGLLLPIGFFMGMAFPLGMRAATDRAASLGPWLWGINGATSVCASVLAVATSLHWGIAATFWAGVACYAVAALALGSLATSSDQAGRAT